MWLLVDINGWFWISLNQPVQSEEGWTSANKYRINRGILNDRYRGLTWKSIPVKITW